MNSKKAITLLVLATLLLSSIPILSANAAVSITTITDTDDIAKTSGTYGEVVVVTGAGVTSGDTIDVYWDFATSAGLINTTTGKNDGTFEIRFKVPSATKGNHYIWIKDVELNQAVMSSAFAVSPVLKFDISSGLAGDTLAISGYGFAASKITTVKFNAEAMTTTPTEIKTTSVGAFTAGIKVPTEDYGTYAVAATDASANTATKNFVIGAAITLSKSEGPAGTVVSVSGRGFDPNVELDEADFTLTGTACAIEDDDTVTISTKGTFTQDVIISSKAAGEYALSVTDGTYTAAADFEVLGNSGLEVTPAYAAPGASVSVSGYNFTQISGSTLSFTIGGASVSDSITVNAAGEFTGTIKMPALTLGVKHSIVATDENGLTANVDVLCGVVTVLLSEYSGPVGTEVSLTATGLKGTEHYAVNITETKLIGDVTNALTAISDTFYVPSVAPGVYMITFYDAGWDIKVLVDFEVTAAASISVTPSIGAPNEFNVTISGVNFAELDSGVLTWTLWNASESWDIVVKTTKTPGVAVTTSDEGVFEAWYVVPDDLDLGTYYINVTQAPTGNHEDSYIYAEAVFNVIAEDWVIATRKDSYALGDTVTFNLRAIFAKLSTLEITDPEGFVYYKAVFAEADWVTVGDWQTIPVGRQVDTSYAPFVIGEDAPIGVWSWKMKEGTTVLETGTFGVTAKTSEVTALEVQVTDLANDIAALAADLVDYSSDFADVQSSIAKVSTLAADAVAAANAATAAINSVSAIANTASEAAADAADAANAARDAANGLTTLVYGAIGAALVAALAAIVSLMQISRRIAG